MISIKEITDNGIKTEKARGFGAEVTEFHRCFLATENGLDAAFGAMTYAGGVCVDVLKVKSGGDPVFDLMARAMMHVLRDMKNITVYTRIEHFSFAALGFKKNGDRYEVKTDDLNFLCAGHKDSN